MTYESHGSLVNKIKNTGYPINNGLCYGFSSIAITALLCGKIDKFNARLKKTYISNEEIKNLVDKLEELKQLTAKGKIIPTEESGKYILTPKELEWLAFCDAIMLAQSTHYYTYLFIDDDKITIQDFLAASQLTLPLAFEKSVPSTKNEKDFICLIDSFSGAYNKNDLIEYFKLFEEKITNEQTESFALQMRSSNHAISVAFDATTMKWHLIDANKIPTQSIELNHAEQLADFVLTSLSQNDNAIFNTVLYTKKSTSHPIKNLFNQLKKENDWSALHEVNTKKSKMLDSHNANWLYIAVKNGNVELANQLIANQANTNQACDDGTTPLYIAVQNGYLDVAKLLIEKEADVNQNKKNGATPLHIAAQNGHLALVELLIEKGANINQPKNDGVTPLYIATHNRHLAVVELLIKNLIKNKEDTNQADDDGTTPLYIAAQNGLLTVVELLLENGADVNQADKNGATPLYIAAKNGHADVVKALLKKEAYVNQAENNGITPLYIAAKYGHSDVTELLLEKGADVNHVYDGVTPLYIAAQNGHVDVVELLLEKGVDVNHVYDGITPLYIAAQNGHVDVAELLLKNGADANKSYNSAAPIFIAAQNGHNKIVQTLLKCSGIQINITFISDKKSLENFAKKERPDIQERMTQWINTQQPKNEKYAMTALDIASIMGHNDIVQMLGKYEAPLQLNQQFALTKENSNPSIFSTPERKTTITQPPVSLSQ